MPGPIGFADPGPSQGYQPPQQPGPSPYQPGPASSPGSFNSLNLPGPNNQSPQDNPGFHAPPSTPQEPQTKPVPATTYTTDWTPPKHACMWPVKGCFVNLSKPRFHRVTTEIHRFVDF